MERNERLQAAFNHLRMKGILKSQKDLANALGATAPHISSALGGDEKYLTDNLLIRFQSKFNQFSLEWLMNGVGEMLNTPSVTDGIRNRIKQLVELSCLSNDEFSSNVGIDNSDFKKKLEGSIEITDEDLIHISKAMNIRLGWLITGQGQIGLLPENIRMQVAIDSYRTQMQQKETEENKRGFDGANIVEVYSKCIRQLEDDRAEVRKELSEIKKVHQQLADELDEVRNLKAILHDAINAFRNATRTNQHAPLMAADED